MKRFNTSVAQHFFPINITPTWIALPYDVVNSRIPIKNYSGVSVEYRQIKAAMGAPKQQMLPSFWSDNSTAITGDFKHPIVWDFPAGLASEFSRESPLKIEVVLQ